MKFRTFITPLAVVSGLVFIAGLVFLGGLLLRNPLVLIDQGGQSVPSALQFVPKQSTVVASLLTRPDRLTDLWEYLTTPSLRKQTQRDIEQIEQLLLAGSGLSYEKDIQPWLGEEITAAVVSPDLDQNPQNGFDPGYLLAFSCQDSQTARVVLELFWQNRAIAGDALVFEDFSGNRLIYSGQRWGDGDSSGPKPSPSVANGLATTLVANQFVLVANHPEVLRQSLTAAQSKDNNLASDWRYRSALKVLPAKRIGLVALSLPDTAGALKDLSSRTLNSVNLNGLEESGDVIDWGLVSLGLTREGILGDIALLAAPGRRLEPRPTLVSELPQAVRYLPDTAAMTVVGLGSESIWSTMQPLWQRYGNVDHLQLLLEQDLSLVLDSNTTHELFEAVNHNSALGLTLGSRPDWLLVSDQTENLTRALQHLQTVAQSQGIGVSTLTLQGHPTTALARLLFKPSLGSPQNSKREVVAQVVGLHTQIDHLGVMASSPALMDKVLTINQGDKLLPDWTTYLSLFQKPNEGYIHINWPKLKSGLRQQASRFRLWETTAKPVFNHIKQVILTSYGRTSERQTGRVFFQLSNQ